MHIWNIYYENADTDEPKRFIGTVQADTMSNALDLAAQFFEIPSHDLVAERKEASQ